MMEYILKKFNEGIQLAGYCSEQLTNAKKKVELLIEKDGNLEAIPFDGKTSGNKELSE